MFKFVNNTLRLELLKVLDVVDVQTRFNILQEIVMWANMRLKIIKIQSNTMDAEVVENGNDLSEKSEK